jgi:hypothetical protein
MSELDDWEVLSGLFPSEWRQMGRSSGAVRRLRGFRSVDDLLRTLLLHVGCGLSLRETAVQAKLAGLADVSDVTLLNRLRDAEPWLLQLCQQVFLDNGVDLQPTWLGRPVRLIDATVVREPGKTGSQWRIHYSLRLPTLECDHFDLTSTRGEGTGEKFGRFRFQPGELVLADAGYCRPSSLAEVVGQQADVCVRLNPRGVSLRNRDDSPFPLLQTLRSLGKAGELGDWPVWIEAGDKRIAGRVCALRKSPQEIQRAQRRLDRKRQRGQSVVDTTRQFAEYVMVFTTLTPDQTTAKQVLEAYRLRWQVELIFKRLKSIAQIGHVPKRDDQSSRSWLYAKLLIALLGEKMARIGRSFSPWGYIQPQTPNPQPMA